MRRSPAPSSRFGLLRLLPARAASLAAPLALLLAALAFAQPAAAQTSVKLVGNTGQADNTVHEMEFDNDYVMEFTTGNNALGYVLTRVDLQMRVGGATAYSLTVEGDAGGGQSTTLNKPASLAVGLNQHSAPGSGFKLTANTTYRLRLNSTANRPVPTLQVTNSDSQGGLAGWSIADTMLFRAWNGTGAWTTFEQIVKFDVHGRAITTPGKPAGVKAGAGSASGSLGVSWTAPSGTITDYDLRYYAGNSDPVNPADWVEEGEAGGPPDPGASTSATITGLSPDTAYRVQVRATNSDNIVGAWSESASARTVTPVSLLSARVSSDGTKLTLYYNERLDGASVPNPGSFAVKVVKASRTPSNVSVAGSTVTLTVAAVNAGQAVAVTYDAPGATSPLRNLAGIKAGRLLDLPVLNGRDATVPTTSASAFAFTSTPTHDRDSSANAPGADTYGLGERIKVEVTFSEAVSVDTSRGAPGLWINLHQASPAVWADYVSGSGTTKLTFAWTVLSGYSSNNGLSDAGIRVEMNRIELAGGKIASVATGRPADLTHAVFGPCVCQKVDPTLGSPKPRFASAVTSGEGVRIIFRGNLDFASLPSSSDFSVTATSPDGTVRSIAGTGLPLADARETDRMTVLLASRVGSRDVVTLSYTGTTVESFSGMPVTNITAAPGLPRTVTAAEGSQSGSLTVTWAAPNFGQTPTGYDLRYYAGTEDPPPGREADWIEDAPGLPDLTDNTATSAVIKGLRANTAYRVQMRAKNAVDISPWTASTSGTTGTPPATNNAPRALRPIQPRPASGNVCEVVTVNGPIKREIVVTASDARVSLSNLVPHGPRTAVGNWPSECTGSHPTHGRINPLFDDVDGDKLTLTAEPHPLPANVRVHSGFNFLVVQNVETNNNINGMVWFQGQSAFRAVPERAVRAKVTATDPHGASVSARVSFVIAKVGDNNGTPSLPVVPALDASPGRAFSHVLPAATGGDNFSSSLTRGEGRQYYYAVSGLPEGLAFDPETRRIFGTPSETGEFTVTYIADDPDTVGSAYLNPETVNTNALNDTASRTFTLNVRPFIDRVRIVSAPTHDANGDGRNDTYVKGDKIAFDVEFTEPVKVEGIKDGNKDNHVRMRLQVGPDGVNKRKTVDLKLANVFHGGKTLRFEYVVAADDNDPDGVFVETFADNAVLRLKGTASIKGRVSKLDANVTKTAFITGGSVGEDGLPMSYVNGRVGAAAGPTPVSATVIGETLWVTFDEFLNPISAADVEALPLHFAVQGASDNLGNRNAFQHPTGYRIGEGNFKTLLMTLGVPARAGDKITLTYKRIDHKGPLKSRILGGSGGDLAPAFVEFVVKNDTGGGTGSGAEGTLVSNTGQSTDTTNTLGTDQALAFTTGSNTKGYKLTKVSVPYSGSVPAASSHEIRIESNEGNRPARIQGTLAYGTVSGTTVTYTASGEGIALAAGTSYFVVLDSSASTSGSSVQLTGSDSEDAVKADGWSLANRSLFKLWNSVAWSTQGSVSWQIAIQGAATAPDPGPRPQSASVAGTKLKILFDKALDDTSSESGQHFTVVTSDRDYAREEIAGTAADVAVSGDTVTVTLADPVPPNVLAHVTYDPPTLSLKAGEGNGRVARFEGFKIETVYDTAVPKLKQAAVVQTSKNPDGFRVALYYDEALDPDSVPATTDFGVTLVTDPDTDPETTISVTANAVAVEGNTVLLTVDLAKAPGEEAVDQDYTTADVSYTKGTNPIRDLAGNEAADVDEDDVEVEVAGTPAVVSAGTVKRTGTLVSNTGQSGGSNNFDFDIAQSFTTGSDSEGYKLTKLVIPYFTSAPSASIHAIRIHASNSSSRPGTSLGTLSYGSVSGTTVTYTASGAGIDLDAGTTYFVVVDTTGASTPSGIPGTDSDNEDAGAAAGWSLGNGRLWRSQAPGSSWNAISDSSQIAIHGEVPVPTLDLKANGSRVTMTFDKSLDPASLPDPERFRLLHDASLGAELEYGRVASVAVQGKQVVLQMGFPVYPCAGKYPFTLSYASSETGKNLRTMTGHEAPDIDAESVTNAQADECVDGRVVVQGEGASGNSGGTPGKQGKSLTVKFERPLDTGKALKASAFGLAGASDGSAPAVEGAAYTESGAGVVLTLARGLGSGETVTLSYTRPAGQPGLWTAAGRQIADFSGVAVPVRSSGAPAATGVEVVSDSGNDDTYALGETIRVRVTFSEAVEVDTEGGTPRLVIDMDPAHWGTKRAAYESGSGTASLTFAHEVVQPNLSTQGIAVLANTLEANGGAIRSASTGTGAELGHDGLDHDPAHKVDWRLAPPAAGTVSVTGVEVVSDSGNDDTYALGETIRVRVTFNEAVEVDMAGGAPRLDIDMDPAHWGTKRAAYESGSGTASLTFAHEVVQPNLSTQGIAVLANTLEANGGAIRSASTGTDAELGHDGLDHDPAHKVDWRLTPAPARTASVTGVAVVSDAGKDDTYGLGDVIRMRVTFSEAVEVDTADGAPRLRIDMDPATHWGAKWTAYESGSGTESLTFAYEVVQPNVSTQGIAVLANTLEVNGGAIRSASGGADALLSHTGLGHDPAHKVDWRPTLSVADTEANEGTDEAVEFEVSLDRAAPHRVTVDYATADGSATAGEDYTATSGTLTFAAGETVKTVSVPILDDAIDEGEETFTLTLSNAEGARIVDGEATGTIINTDAMPAAWLARFGRTVTDQVVDAVTARMQAQRAAGAAVTLAGQALPSWTPGDNAPAGDAANDNGAAETSFGDDPENRDAMEALRRWMVFTGSDGDDPRGTGAAGFDAFGDNDRPVFETRALTQRDLFVGTSFALTARAGGGGFASLWGRAAVSSFDGREGDLSLDGEVTTGFLGADWASEPRPEPGGWMAGLVLGHSTGTGGYRLDGCDTTQIGNEGPASGCAGNVEATLTGLYPWAATEVSDRLSVWAVAGRGSGRLTLRPDGGTALTTDMGMTMGAAGMRSEVLKPVGGDGFALAIKGDARFSRTSSKAIASEAGNLVATKASVWLVRLGIEGSRGFALDAEGARVTPSFEIGLRRDGGDAETGFGTDMGFGLAFADPANGLNFDLKGRGLVVHKVRGFRDWGMSTAFSWDPRPETDLGLAMSLTRSWGASPTGGMDALLSRETLAGLAANENADSQDLQAAGRLQGEIAYGTALFGGGFTATPNMGFGISDGGGREYRIGWRLTPALQGSPRFEVSLDATRNEAANSNAPAHGVMLRSTVSW